MAQKFLDQVDFNTTANFNGKLIVNDSLWDYNSSQGSVGQVLTKDSSNNPVWATPSGGGTIDGSGAANKLAIWSDADTLTSDTNLHWDTTNDRLGIGTASPSDKLHITGANNFNGLRIEGTSPGIYLIDTEATSAHHISSNGDALYFLRDTDQNGSYNNIMAYWKANNDFIFNLGNVGIGTASPTSKLNVNEENGVSTVVISRGGTNLTTGTALGDIIFPADYDGTPTNYASINAYANALSSVRGSLDFKVKSTSGNLLTGMTVYGTHAGVNIGIGTTSPEGKLHVKINDSGATPISQQHLILENNSATGLGILTPSSTSGYIFFGDENDAQRGYISYSHSTDNMTFKVNGAERMRIDSSGSLQLNNYGSGTFTGTATKMLAVDASGNVVEETLPSGGGSLTGSGTANTMTKWSSTSGLTDSSHMTEDATGIIIGGGSASAKLHVKDDVKFGTDGLFYDHSAKRVGLGTITPAQLLHVNGGMRLEGVFQDGANSSGTSGQILKSTGTDTIWANPSSIAYRDSKVLHSSWKVGTTGTVYFDWTGGGSQSSLAYTNGMVLPYDGTLTGVTVMSDGTQTGFSFALLQQSGTSLWSVTSQTLTANTPKSFSMSTDLTQSTDKSIHFRMIRSTSSTSNYNIIVTLTFEWNN